MRRRPSNKETRRPHARRKQEAGGRPEFNNNLFTVEGHSDLSRGSSQAPGQDDKTINKAREHHSGCTGKSRAK